MEDVKSFFKKHYNPANAIMVVAGNVETDHVKQLAEKWFADIPAGIKPKRNLPLEPIQKEKRVLSVSRDVPVNAIYKTFHMCSRMDQKFYTTDIISDLLSRGNSSRLYISLVKELKLFTEINAYVSGEMDPGLFIISGRLNEKVTMEQAEKGIDDEIKKLLETKISEEELQKCKNRIESALVFGEMEALNKATNLAISELMGGAHLINEEAGKFQAVTIDDVRNVAKEMFKEENSSVLYYNKIKK